MKASGRVVIFDLDGTLVDATRVTRAAVAEVSAHHGLSVAPAARLLLDPSVGTRALLRSLAPGRERALAEEFTGAWCRHLYAGVAICPVARALCQTLESRGGGWAVVTNRSLRMTQALFAHLGPAFSPRVTITPEAVGARKPSARPLLEAARRLGLSPESLTYVGDSEIDRVAAGRAGIAYVSIHALRCDPKGSLESFFDDP